MFLINIDFILQKINSRDDISSEDEDDELDSRNCTIDDDQNESIIIHPRVVIPQSSTKKRLLNHDDENDVQKMISPSKRLRYEDSRQIVTNKLFLLNLLFLYYFNRLILHHNELSLKQHLNVIHHQKILPDHLLFQAI